MLFSLLMLIAYATLLTKCNAGCNEMSSLDTLLLLLFIKKNFI